MDPRGEGVLPNFIRIQTRARFVTLLTGLVILLTGFVESTQAGTRACHTGGRVLLAQAINPDRLKAPQTGRVCCVAGTRRFHSTADACRRSGGAVRPLSTCAVTQTRLGCCKLGATRYQRVNELECKRLRGRMVKDLYCHVHEPVCCLQGAGTARRKYYETTRSRCRRAGGEEQAKEKCNDSFGNDPAFEHLQSAVCCRTPTEIISTTSVGCFSRGGSVVDNAYCGSRQICCRRADGRGHFLATWEQCRRSGGSLAGDWACRR